MFYREINFIDVSSSQPGVLHDSDECRASEKPAAYKLRIQYPSLKRCMFWSLYWPDLRGMESWLETERSNTLRTYCEQSVIFHTFQISIEIFQLSYGMMFYLAILFSVTTFSIICNLKISIIPWLMQWLSRLIISLGEKSVIKNE